MTSRARVLLGFVVVSTSFLSGSFQSAGAQTPREAPAPSVPRECTGRYMAGPAVGIPLGLSVAAFGSVLVAAASADLFESSRPNDPAERGAIAGGSIMIGAGLASFIYSSVKLSKNRRTRKRVCGSSRKEEEPHRVQWDFAQSRLVF